MQNFGKITETFKEILLEGILNKNDKNKKVFKRFLSLIKEDKTLKTQYNIYNRLENKIKYDDEERSNLFIDECISILNSLGKNKILESNNKLVKLLEKNGYEVCSDNYEFKTLHEHINNLIFLNKNSKNIDAIIESKLFLKNHSMIAENKDKPFIEPYTNKFLIPLTKKKFNEKYSNITELEQKAIKLGIKGDVEDKKALYESTINDCVDLVNEQLNNSSTEEKDTLLKVKDKLLRYKFSEEKFISEIIDLNYLFNTLK